VIVAVKRVERGREREISKDQYETKQQSTESSLTNFGSFNPLITQAEPHVSHWILSLPAFFQPYRATF
jgi:hypothetical protein